MELTPHKDSEGNETGKKVRTRRIYWEDTGTSRGKDRTRALAPHTDNLKLKQIRELIENYTPPVKRAVAKKAPAKAAPAKKAAPEPNSAVKATTEHVADAAEGVPAVDSPSK